MSIESYKEKVRKDPANVANYIDLGNLYEKEGRFQEAIDECYLTILRFQPYNGATINQIGVCYFNMGQYKTAIEYFKKVLQLRELSDVYRNIALCYAKMKIYKRAEKYSVLAYNLEPTRDDNKGCLAELYFYYKQYDKSITFYKKIKNLDDTILPGYNAAFPYLGKQDFKNGFYYYQFRLKHNPTNVQTKLVERLELPQIKDWDGIQPCNRLLLIYEQGIGDNIQFYRFILQLARTHPSMQITFFCRQDVLNMFRTDLEGIHNLEVVFNLQTLDYDYKAYSMSVPYFLKIESITPNTDEYIKTNPEKIEEWKEKLSHLGKFRIGFMYNGLLLSFIEKNIPLSNFLPLCDLDVEWICLHRKKDIDEDIKKFPKRNNMHFLDIDNDGPFVDTIAILKNIDLLITIDTSIVHIAGAMNVKTWLLLGKYSDWRWSNKEQNYWYNSVELIRNEDGELKKIIPTVKEKLQTYLAENPHHIKNI
jgi:tetratricopeptide (TPR) repeat protein